MACIVSFLIFTFAAAVFGRHERKPVRVLTRRADRPSGMSRSRD